jgi:16S rRNA (cytosine1402-N4)-methyltransferase
LPNSTLELARIIVAAMRQRNFSKAHPATRSFQAIRMAVNHELDELEALLADLPLILAKDGVAVFLSFHSLEDRLIKQAFKKIASETSDGKKFSILTKKPQVASDQEIKANRRSRSAKLRALMRIA